MSAVSLDRFAYGLPDPQADEAPEVAACAYCGRPLRLGEPVLKDAESGDLYCDSRCYIERMKEVGVLRDVEVGEEDALWR